MDRPWGKWSVLYENSDNTTKVKRLVVNPNSSLSRQKHASRNELWHVVEGKGIVELYRNTNFRLEAHSMIEIPAGGWHKLINDSDEELVIIEIQYGDTCDEEDIERQEDDADEVE